MRKIKKRIKEICDILDVDIYWKNCNFLENEEDDDIPTFYSRDECHSITFRELLKWYLPRLGSWQDEPDCNDCDHVKCKNFTKIEECEERILDKDIKERHYSLFLELVDIYAYYTQQDHVKYKELKDKCKSLLYEIMQ